ncbi:conjugal transfer protein TrbG/VirB9/CagX [Burkholderiales bacterium GJ-E10]|nr:conjugal transfer protein TrbG/VirB9/CagX [Burkholderiales bacterium GJ-E10]
MVATLRAISWNLRGMLACAALALLCGNVQAQTRNGGPEVATENSIESVTATQAGADVLVTIRLKTPIPTVPSNFSIIHPARIVLDLANTTNGLKRNAIVMDRGDLHSIEVVQAQGRTRVVLNLMRPAAYNVSVEDSAVLVSINAAPAPIAASSVSVPPIAPTSLDLAQRPAQPLSERAAELAARQWQKSGQAQELVGSNGEVMYPYGASRPTITCAPLHVCVIQLIDGEKIASYSIGDNVRWLVQTAGTARPIVAIKPTQPDIVTNLMIATDAGRVYYLTLESDPVDYVPMVGFYDPGQLVMTGPGVASDADARSRARGWRSARDQALGGMDPGSVVAPLGSVDPSRLDFGWTCQPEHGSDAPVSVRVFSAQGHVYVQMPQDAQYGNAPAIFGLDGDSPTLINSRMVGYYYVIDGQPRHFRLLLGVGKHAAYTDCAHAAEASVAFSAPTNPWTRYRHP